MSKLPKHILTFEQFMIRRQVLSLYRDFLKVISKAPKDDRFMMKEWVRHDFDKNKSLKNETDIKMQLSRGRLSLREVSSAIHLAK